MSTHREIEEAYKNEIIKKSKMIKEMGESLGQIEKGERTLEQIKMWVKKRKKKTKKSTKA